MLWCCSQKTQHTHRHGRRAGDDLYLLVDSSVRNPQAYRAYACVVWKAEDPLSFFTKTLEERSFDLVGVKESPTNSSFTAASVCFVP
jgi:hypothetical protein